MLKVITTVGTSIFENYRKYCQEYNKEKLTKNYLKESFDSRDSELDEEIKEKIKIWIKEISSKTQISAEIKSLLKLKEEKKNENIEVFLLATDTVASSLAAEILKEFLEKENFIVYFDPKKDVIKDLQVEDFDRFEKGKNNLIHRISKLIEEFVQDEKGSKKRKFIRKNVVFNITGGYKSIIPILTILAQLYESRLFYIFEESNDAIAIPRIPINFDPFLLESLYVDIFLKKHTENYKFRNEYRLKEFGFIDKRNNITALGELFYQMAYTYNPLSPNVLGHFVEYKILEYLCNEKIEFIHSYKYQPDIELDFVFKHNVNEWEVWEIKPLALFLKPEQKKEVVNQFKKHLINVNEIKQYRVIVYSITDAIEKNLKNIVLKIADDLRKEFPDIDIAFDFLLLHKMNIKDQDKSENPYQALFKYSVKKESFKNLV